MMDETTYFTPLNPSKPEYQNQNPGSQELRKKTNQENPENILITQT